MDRHPNGQRNKEVMRSCKWMDRQHNGQRNIHSFSLSLWPSGCLSIHLQLLIASLAIVLSVHPFTASHYLFVSFAIMLSVHPFTASHYLFVSRDNEKL
jgi:hypothetical protein